jgi:hypothetical protein
LLPLGSRDGGRPRTGNPRRSEIQGFSLDARSRSGRIRHAWLTHVAAEEPLFAKHDTEADWEAYLPTMLGVFTDDCVMQLAWLGLRWDGQAGARQFYREFITAFDNMAWVPQSLVIGPQGVLDVANMSGVLVKDFGGFKATGTLVRMQWVISVPWVPEQQRFSGETIHSIRMLTPDEVQ